METPGRRLGYVLAVAKSHRVNVGGLPGTARGDHVAATLGNRVWNRYSAGNGAKGRREYGWAWVADDSLKTNRHLAWLEYQPPST